MRTDENAMGKTIPGLRAHGRLCCVPLILLGLLALVALTPAVMAESPPETSSPVNPTSDEAEPAPVVPPGTLGAEGVVPEQGVAGPAKPEDIGHVPGPNEGVYGDPPNSGVGNPDDRDWAYDSSFLFGLTRGLPEATDLSKSERRWVSSLTLPYDLVTLPTAALAGLYGRAPVPEAESPEDEESQADAPAAAEDAASTDDAEMSDDAEAEAETESS